MTVTIIVKSEKGASGLTAGNLLARSGLKVLILEKHYNTGGGTHSWEDKGQGFTYQFKYDRDLGP